jgi:cytochrome b involved in lipid metabolism
MLDALDDSYPADSVTLANPSSDNDIVTDVLPAYTMDEVARHNTKESCWVVIRDKVYDTTAYNNMHPGGAASILMCSGGDGTEDFEAIAVRQTASILPSPLSLVRY